MGLRKYAEAKLGAGAWDKLLAEANLDGNIYYAVSNYPDHNMVRLVGAAARITGLTGAAILEDFGQSLVPELVTLYKPLIRSTWKTIDLLENTEELIHSVVRVRNEGASPPQLKVDRLAHGELRIVYTSARRMCSLLKGIVRGIAALYGEKVTLDEVACMQQEANRCEFLVRV